MPSFPSSSSSSSPQQQQQLSRAEQEAVMAELQRLQVKDSMDTYNSVVERCFNECITQFKSKDLEAAEILCVKTCVHKFMTFSQRVGQRFAERNIEQGSR